MTTQTEPSRAAPANVDAASIPFARELIDHLPTLACLLDLDGRVVHANPAMLAAAGVTLDRARGAPLWTCPWWSRAVAAASLRDACARAAHGEAVHHDADSADDTVATDWTIAPLHGAHGEVALLLASAVEATARLGAERRLQTSQARVARLFETNLLGIFYWQVDGRITQANDELLRILGFDREDLASGLVDWVAMTPPEYRDQDVRALADVLREGVHTPIEKEYVRKDGSRVWVLVGSALVDEREGIGFCLDIDAAKRNEAKLRESEQRARDAATRAETERGVLDAILRAAPAGIIVADAGGKLVRFNPANELLWGPAPASESVDEYAEWKGWWADASPRRGRRVAPHEWAMSRALEGETVRGDLVEIEPFDAPGVRRTMLNSGAPVLADGGRVTGAVVVQMDISALVAAEAARSESEARFHALADNIAQLAWIADANGYLTWFNRRWFELTGGTLEDMRGFGWQRVHHPDHVARVTAKFMQHVASGEPWEDTFPLRSRTGEYRWFLSRAFPLRDEEGRIVRWFGTNTDVTFQREAEERLREADRRKDEFIAVLAHELRNPLAPVRNAVQLLQRAGRDETRAARATEVIDRQVTHMSRIIDDLLDVSRIAHGKLTLQRERCDLARIVRQTSEDYRDGLEAAGVALTVQLPSAPLEVDGNPVRLAQMVANLLHNAGRFTDRGGRVVVRARADEASSSAEISVADTGVGLAPELAERLFEPFTQAHQDLARSRGGLGLGLALTKGLVELHGGRVSATSEGPGRGATFTLRVPLVRGDEAPAHGEDASVATRPRLRVLIVEDNRDAAETLGELLALGGREIALAFDGEEAERVAPAFAPDVVISDLGLPGALDGYALARRLRSLPVTDRALLVAMSGYTDTDARKRSREAGFDVHVAKPPDIAALERLLWEAGERGPGRRSPA